VTMRNAPRIGRETREEVPVICPTPQAKCAFSRLARPGKSAGARENLSSELQSSLVRHTRA
jgi:hypothetical protein